MSETGSGKQTVLKAVEITKERVGEVRNSDTGRDKNIEIKRD